MEPTVERLRAESKTAGLFLDFDGTLSEIVPVPSEARPVVGATDVLARLFERFAVVAVVSGRSAHELLEWLGPDVEIWGAHGAQRVRNGRASLSPRAEPFRELMARVSDDVRRRLDDARLEGLSFEDKAVMLNLHYRNATDRDDARRRVDEIAHDVAARHGLGVTEGRFSIELRPPEEFTKATVVLDRAREARLTIAAFVGDDRVDLPGFDALDQLEREGLTGVRVAVDSEETPPELLERADVVVDGPAGVLEFLRALL